MASPCCCSTAGSRTSCDGCPRAPTRNNSSTPCSSLRWSSRRRPESLTRSAAGEMRRCSQARHARPCAGHPRLSCLCPAKTWMAGTNPAMTRMYLRKLRRHQLLYRCRVEIENPRGVQPENIALGLLGQERQVANFLRQVEIEMRPVGREHELRLGLDHLQRVLERLRMRRLHRLRRVVAIAVHVF